MSRFLIAVLPYLLNVAMGSEEAPVCSAEGECEILDDNAAGEELKTSLLQTKARQQAKRLDVAADDEAYIVVNATEQQEGEPCLCTFDIDRTLTGKQGDTHRCPKNLISYHVQNGAFGKIYDTAYGGGIFTLSPVGQSIKDTFCARCYVGVVTAGDASGHNSGERKALLALLEASGATVLNKEWEGPSKYDGSKQEAVKGIVQYMKEKGVVVKPERVWHFDDRKDNIVSFKGTGFNARMISCGSRDHGGSVGRCGAMLDEIVEEPGIKLCDDGHDYNSCKSYGCNGGYVRGRKCQCNRACAKYNSCCADYKAVCS